jgi:hypothetical protein
MIALLADRIRGSNNFLRAEVDAECASLAIFFTDDDFRHR